MFFAVAVAAVVLQQQSPPAPTQPEQQPAADNAEVQTEELVHGQVPRASSS